MVMSTEEFSRRRAWTAFLLSSLSATCAWMLLLAGPKEGDSPGELIAYVACAVTITTLLALLYPLATRSIGLGLMIVPIVVAVYTVDRGDGDGLWSLVIVFLAVVASVSMAVGVNAARVLSRVTGGSFVRFGRALIEQPSRHAMTLGVATAVTAWITIARWPAPGSLG